MQWAPSSDLRLSDPTSRSSSSRRTTSTTRRSPWKRSNGRHGSCLERDSNLIKATDPERHLFRGSSRGSWTRVLGVWLNIMTTSSPRRTATTRRWNYWFQPDIYSDNMDQSCSLRLQPSAGTPLRSMPVPGRDRRVSPTTSHVFEHGGGTPAPIILQRPEVQGIDRGSMPLRKEVHASAEIQACWKKCGSPGERHLEGVSAPRAPTSSRYSRRCTATTTARRATCRR